MFVNPEECEGYQAVGHVCLSICLSGRVTQKVLLRLTFYTSSVPLARSSNMICIWTQEFV